MRLTIFLTTLIISSLLLGCGGSGGNGDPTIPPPKQKETEWTVMIYMGADNNLAQDAIIDINELEQVGSTDEVHFTVLADVFFDYSIQYGGPVITIQDDNGIQVAPMMHITRHPEEGVQSHLADANAVLYPLSGFNSADPNNLKEFINWSVKRFPAKRYALVIWNHGSSWLPGRAGSASISDDHSQRIMYIHEIEPAITGSGIQIDLTVFDACNMASVEVFYQLRNVTDFVIGSQKTEPGEGDDYQAIASYLTSHQDASAESLGKVWVNSFVNFHTNINEHSVTRSLIRTDRLPEVAQAVNQLTPLLADPTVISSNELLESFSGPIRFFRDVDLSNYTYVVPYFVQNPTLNAALNLVREKVHNAVVYNRTFSSDAQDPSWTFGTREFGEGEDINVTGAEGISIFLPTDRDWTQNNFGYYSSTAFNQATGWSYVIARAYEGIPCLLTAPGNWMAKMVWSTNVDLDLWVFEPDGQDGLVPASPCLGPNSINGYLSTDSHWTGISAEAYMTKPEIIWGPYFFLSVYYMNSIFPPQSDAWCMLAIGDIEDYENGTSLTTSDYYISASQPDDPDFGPGVVYFGFALYNPDDGYWYFFEGDRGGDAVRVDQKSVIRGKLDSLKPGVTKTQKPQGFDDGVIAGFHEQGLVLAEKLQQELENKK